MSDAMEIAGYGTLLTELKTRIHTAQYAALRAVNKELIALYRDIGKLIEERQTTEGWGKAVVERLSADLREGRLRKVYRALVAGIPAEACFCVEVPIGPVPYAPLGRLHAATPGGAPARSLVRVIQPRHTDGQTLVEVEIPTGRPHQIRIHLAAAGYPLAGDPLYGPGGVPKAPLPGQRPALPGDGGYHLHAWRVELRHPADLTLLALSCAPPEILRTAGETAAGA